MLRLRPGLNGVATTEKADPNRLLGVLDAIASGLATSELYCLLFFNILITQRLIYFFGLSFCVDDLLVFSFRASANNQCISLVINGQAVNLN